jgi:putative oxidoreductase
MQRTENGTLLAGRVLLSAIFLLGGWTKLLAATATQTAFGQRYGLPMPEAAWLLAVVIELGGGLLLLFGLFTRPLAIVLAVWCLATALVAHTNFADPIQRAHFMKNVAMMGGFLYVAAVGAGAWSLDAWRSRRRAVPA